jgi:rubrerythrin
MESGSVTTAAIISFTEKLEDDSTAFYEEMARRWPEHAEPFQSFARDGQKNRVQVVRTYQETISDALEASYAFEGLNLASFSTDTTLSPDTTYAAALSAAITLEDGAVALYLDIAARSESLLATIPRAFKRVAKKRARRKEDLQSMLGAAE